MQVGDLLGDYNLEILIFSHIIKHLEYFSGGDEGIRTLETATNRLLP